MRSENTWQEIRDHSFIQNHSRSFRFTDPWRCFFSSVHSCSTGFRSENTWQEIRDHSFIQNHSRSFRFTDPWQCFFSSLMFYRVQVREHLTRDQRPFLHPESLQILQIHRSMTVLLQFTHVLQGSGQRTPDKRSETIPSSRITPDPSDSQIHDGASSVHSCSTGFRSEDWNGYISLVLCSVTHFCVVFEVCVWIIVRLEDPNMARYKISNRVYFFSFIWLEVSPIWSSVVSDNWICWSLFLDELGSFFFKPSRTTCGDVGAVWSFFLKGFWPWNSTFLYNSPAVVLELWSSIIFCCTSEIYSLFFLIVTMIKGVWALFSLLFIFLWNGKSWLDNFMFIISLECSKLSIWMGIYFRDISRGANNCVQRVFKNKKYFIMIIPPFFFLIIQWKVIFLWFLK